MWIIKKKILKRAVVKTGESTWPLAQGDEAGVQPMLSGNPEEICWQTTRNGHPEMTHSGAHLEKHMVAWKHS